MAYLYQVAYERSDDEIHSPGSGENCDPIGISKGRDDHGPCPVNNANHMCKSQ